MNCDAQPAGAMTEEQAENKLKQMIEGRVKQYWHDATPESINATKEYHFADGVVWSVVIKDRDNNPQVNYCYTSRDGIDRYDTLAELTRALGRKRNLMSLMYSVLDVGGIAGIIAIIITITLCIIAVFVRSTADEKVITALTIALGSVMGFYFGKKTQPEK